MEHEKNEVLERLERERAEEDARTETMQIDVEVLGTITKAQANVIRQLRRTILDDMGGDPRFERFTIRKSRTRRIGIIAHAIRTDCGRSSPRCILTEQRASWVVGPRGGITVLDSSVSKHGTKTEAAEYPYIYGITKGLN